MVKIQEAFFGLAWGIYNCAHEVYKQQQAKGIAAVGSR